MTINDRIFSFEKNVSTPPPQRLILLWAQMCPEVKEDDSFVKS